MWQGCRLWGENTTVYSTSLTNSCMVLKIIKFMQTMVKKEDKRVILFLWDLVFWFQWVCWSIAWWVNMLRNLYLDLWVIEIIGIPYKGLWLSLYQIHVWCPEKWKINDHSEGITTVPFISILENVLWGQVKREANRRKISFSRFR